MVDNINIKSPPKKKFSATVVGVEYECVAPKGRLAMTIATRFKLAQQTQDASQVDETLNVIIVKMFGKEIAPSVIERLDDPDDDLDIEHIMELMNALISEASGDPTT